ncbi:protein kinase [bacterium]|nr:protein kinase [bacterium]
MDPHSYFLPDTRPSGASSSLGLPVELLEKSRRRLRILGILVLVATGADLLQTFVAFALVLLGHDVGEPPSSAIPFTGTVVSFLAALGVILLTRSRRVGAPRLVTLGQGFEVLLCLIIAVTNPLSRYEAVGSLPTMTWVTPIIILFPLIAPSPPRRTLVTALLAAATRPLGLWLLGTLGHLPVKVDDYAAAVFSPMIAVVFATFGARAVYDLGMDVARARRMGSYELETLLGRGGMGEVWRARHRLLARPAAIKLIRPEFLGGASERERQVMRQRFEREAKATAALRSPHSVELFDYGVSGDGTFYYVMELLEGVDAQALVAGDGPLPWPRAVFLLRQVCHSLAEAHGGGLVHRDIKPANVFVCRYGLDLDFVKVLDFGLVKQAATPLDDTDPLTVQGGVQGTPAFMAPEQALGKGDDARADLYAVGCLAYWMLTGQTVFTGETAMELLVQHARSAPAAPSTRTELPIPPALEALVMACLEKDPAARPQTAGAVDAALADCEREERWTPAQARRWWDTHHPV